MNDKTQKDLKEQNTVYETTIEYLNKSLYARKAEIAELEYRNLIVEEEKRQIERELDIIHRHIRGDSINCDTCANTDACPRCMYYTLDSDTLYWKPVL